MTNGAVPGRLGDATDLEGVGGSFDFLVCTRLISHLDAPADTARAALSKLSPGGTAAFVFLTKPRGAILGWIVERLETCAAGMATLAVFRAPVASG